MSISEDGVKQSQYSEILCDNLATVLVCISLYDHSVNHDLILNKARRAAVFKLTTLTEKIYYV